MSRTYKAKSCMFWGDLEVSELGPVWNQLLTSSTTAKHIQHSPITYLGKPDCLKPSEVLSGPRRTVHPDTHTSSGTTLGVLDNNRRPRRLPRET